MKTAREYPRALLRSALAGLAISIAPLGLLAQSAPADSRPAANPAAPAIPVSRQIIVDQFGFRPRSEKVVIFASPQEGQNANVKYTPPAKASVCRAADSTAVLTVDLKPWGQGQTDPTSGDKVWYADISALATPGTYYVLDPENKLRSWTFRIADDVYAPVLKAAVRGLFYERCGGDIPEPNGGKAWNHPACHVREGQDKEAQLYIDGQLRGQPRDVHGGWHDAGDYNKYVPYTGDVISTLLLAYQFNPNAFGDSWNIPESGNGIPDLLDEVAWECDWVLRMQLPERAICNRVTARKYALGVTPDQDKNARVYTQPTSWATAVGAADMAAFARVIGKFPDQAQRAAAFRAAAEKAWAWLEQHPDMTPADGKDHGRPSDATEAGCDADGDRQDRALAAAQLWLLDPQKKYQDYLQQWRKNLKSKPAERLRNPAFIAYALAPNADPALVADIRAALKEHVDNEVLGSYKSQKDAYRSYLSGYWWGSNQIKSEYGFQAIFAVKLALAPGSDDQYRAAAEEYLHYIHGRNPLNLVYLTNMAAKGANLCEGDCIMSPFHYWFAHKSPWDGPTSLGPAPGILVGGANWKDHGAPDWLVPPAKQPPTKSYKDWNQGWNDEHRTNENCWAYSEPGIYYQARYILLLSNFAALNPAAR